MLYCSFAILPVGSLDNKYAICCDIYCRVDSTAFTVMRTHLML
jgi:hypothetical protein